MKSDMERLQNNNDLLKEENTIQEEAIDEFKEGWVSQCIFTTIEEV